jgi:Domain of unknown function (DUF4190)
MSYPPEPPGYGQGGQQGPPGQPPGQQPGQPPGQQPGPPYGYYGPGPHYGADLPTTNGKATAALAVGIGSLVLSWCCGLGIVGVVAIVLGVKARGEIRDSHGRQEGDGFALGGIITGAIAVVLGLLVLVLIALALVAGTSFETTTTYGTEL